MGDCALVVLEIMVKCVLELLVGCLEFYEEERESVDESNEICSTCVEIPGDPEL